ncbi:hypothetical protein ABIE59_002351 [Marinobacter sp. MBR-99]|jgi:hypothetical protein
MPRQVDCKALPHELIFTLSDTFQKMSEQGFAVVSALESDHVAG